MTPPSRRSSLLALLVVTLIWGIAFIWMKQNLTAAERVLGRPGGMPVVAFYLLARFGVAAAVLALWPAARRGLTKDAWRGGAVIGALLAGGFFLQMLGLEEVGPAVSAFLTSLYVVFAAILTAVLHRTRPRLTLVVGVILATFGAGFIAGPPQLTFGRAEWLTVGCAAIFGGHILATDRFTRSSSPASVSLTSFVVTALCGGIVGTILLRRPGAPSPAEMAAIFRDPEFLTALALGSLLATVLALTLMNLYQKGLDPVRAAIVYALEPIWTTLIAWAWGMGAPTGWLLVGGGALLAGNLVAEWGAASES